MSDKLPSNAEYMARHLHKWESGYLHAVQTFKLGVPDSYEVLYYNHSAFPRTDGVSRSEWKAERARIQNKPSWDQAPEDAKALVFDPRKSAWRFEKTGDLYALDSVNAWSRAYWTGEPVKGECLGDYKDSLEFRPVPVATPAYLGTFSVKTAVPDATQVTIEKLQNDKAHFYDLALLMQRVAYQLARMGTESSGEAWKLVRTKMDEVKGAAEATDAAPPTRPADPTPLNWDGKHYPPVGTRCEATYTLLPGDKASDWIKGTYKGSFSGQHWFGRDEDPALSSHEKDIIRPTRHIKFRPLHSEVEEAIEAMLALDPFNPNSPHGMLSRREFCRALHHAGFKQEAK